MAGGTFTSQNKVLPGVYINYESAKSSLVSMGERGVVAIARMHGWLESGTFTVIDDPNKCFEIMGYDITSDEMKFVRQLFLGTNRTTGASKILFWKLGATGEAAATVTIGNLTATAVYKGTRGNDIKVVITSDPDNTETSITMYVQTLVEGVLVDSQTVTGTTTPTVSDLSDNAWVKFTGTGALQATTGASLIGGLDGTLSATSHSNFLNALENKDFNVVCYDGTSATYKAAYAAFAKRLSNELGLKRVAVVSDYNTADFETCISVKAQSVSLDDGSTIADNELTWWVSGCTAGADVNQSLTNATYPGVTSITPELSKAEQISAIENGEFALINSFDSCRVLSDINTFRSYTSVKNSLFSKNRNIRTIFGLANDIYATFANYYVGEVNNDKDGRSILKGEVISLMMQYQSKHALQNVDADDVEVEAGESSDSVIINVAVQLVDSVEKIYIKITCS